MHIKRVADNLRFVFQPQRKPMLLARLTGSYLRYISANDPLNRPLRNVDVALDYACNLACEHCSCAMFTHHKHKMENKDYMRLSDESMTLGAIYFAFTGGEPLINKSLEDIVQIFKPKKNLIGIQTNALLLTARRAASLYKAGVDAIQVSLDSGDPGVHDSFRNCKGAFHETLKNVSSAIKLGFGVIFSATLTHSSLRSQSTRALLQFAESLDVPVVISVPCPVGCWRGDHSEQFTQDDRQFLNRLQKRFPRLRRDFHSNYWRMGCTAGTEKLYITPYGDVIPCPFIHVSFGNLLFEPLKTIRARILQIDDFKRYSQICLAGEDNSFIDRYLRPSYDSVIQPVAWSDHPRLKHRNLKKAGR